eukprot:3125131-Alexandrium_andersonii.AAC.1
MREPWEAASPGSSGAEAPDHTCSGISHAAGGAGMGRVSSTPRMLVGPKLCLLYTSDAADDM